MTTCSATTAKGVQCKNASKTTIGKYYACGIKSHIIQVEKLGMAELPNEPTTPPAPHRPLEPGVSPLLPVVIEGSAQIVRTTVVKGRSSQARAKQAPAKSKPKVIRNQGIIYTVIAEIGRGAYGIVEEVELEGQVYANKQQQAYDGCPGVSGPTLVEADIMSRFIHPNIVGAKDIFFQQGVNTMVNFVMTREGRQLRGNNPTTPSAIKDFLFQLFSAMDFLHGEYVIHADLKPENILLTTNKEGKVIVRVADFGLSQYDLPQSKSVDVQTYWYRSPEIFARNRFYSIEIDVWSLGLIMREIVTGTPLSTVAESKHLKDVLEKMGVDYELSAVSTEKLRETIRAQKDNKSGKTTTRSELLKQLSISNRLILLQSLKTVPDITRNVEASATGVKLKEAFGSEWPEYLRVMNACFAIDPLQRISVHTMLQSSLFQGMTEVQGEVLYEEVSSPPLATHEVYDMMEQVVADNVYYNKSSLILGIDLFDRVRVVLEWGERELALCCLNIALKLNQRTALSIATFIKTLNQKTYKPLDAWYLETQITQALHFRLYIENVAIRCPSYSFDLTYQVFREVHRAGENTRDFAKLCVKIKELVQKDESHSSSGVSQPSRWKPRK